MRPMHRVLDHRYPFDGKQFVACTCPLGVDHPPVAVMVPVDDEPGQWWVRFQGEVVE